MNGKFLLDTNIVIAHFAADSTVAQRLDSAVEVFIPSVVLGELYYVARKSSRVEENLMRLDEFAESSSVLSCDIETARNYGAIKNSLRAKGRPIPENDIWIAAIALQHQATLVTRDSHFGEISDLATEYW